MVLVRKYEEENIMNADQTHFIININNEKILGFSADETVQYAYVISDGEVITILVRLSGGKNVLIDPPLMIFKNKD